MRFQSSGFLRLLPVPAHSGRMPLNLSEERTMSRFAFALAITLGMAGSAVAQEEPTGWWTDETSAYYFARGGAATDGTYLYLFGGYQLGVSQSYPSYYRRARRYDPASNAWLTLANLPIVESDITYQYNAGAYYDGRLYSFGTSYADASGIVLSRSEER